MLSIQCGKSICILLCPEKYNNITEHLYRNQHVYAGTQSIIKQYCFLCCVGFKSSFYMHCTHRYFKFVVWMDVNVMHLVYICCFFAQHFAGGVSG